MEIALFRLYRLWKSRFTSFAGRDRWAFEKTALWLCLFCVLASFPTYELFWQPNEIVATNWQALQLQANHPLTPVSYPPDEHRGQLAFRILLPGLAYLTHLPIGYFFALLPVMGWLFFTLLLRLGRRAGLESWTDLLLAIGLAATYVGKSFFVDVLGYFDAYCHILLLLAIASRRRSVIFLTVLAACYVDERAYLAAPAIAMARWFWKNQVSLLQTPTFWREAFTILAALLAAIGLRLFLHIHYGLVSGAQSENLGLFTLRANYQIASLGLLSGLDGWIFVGYAPAFYLLAQRRWLIGIGFASYYTLAILSMLVVLDLTRCTAFLFPAVLAGVFAIARHERPVFTEKANAFFCAFAMIMPPMFFVGSYILWMGPFIPRIFKVASKLLLHVNI